MQYAIFDTLRACKQCESKLFPRKWLIPTAQPAESQTVRTIELKTMVRTVVEHGFCYLFTYWKRHSKDNCQ